jgi:hypothetical protein
MKWTYSLFILFVVSLFVGINMIILSETTDHDTVAMWVGFNAGVIMFLSLFGSAMAAELESM